MRCGGNILSLLACWGLGMLLGCAVGPTYQAPEIQTAAQWQGPTDQMNFSEKQQSELVHWWTLFNDLRLTSLVERAVKSNLDGQLAQARLRQVRAARAVVAGGSWPAVEGQASYARSRTGGVAGQTSASAGHNLFQVGLDATWEIDIFGALQRRIDAAEAAIQTSIEDQRDILVSLGAEVAFNYIELRGIQQELIIARNNVKAQQHTADLTKKRFKAGFNGALDLANAETQVATTASQIPELESAANQTIYNLSVLLALPPAALMSELAPSASIPSPPPELPMILPSDLLQRRPDIRRAETEIQAAWANIGVATADLYPHFNLMGSAGLQSSGLSGLTSANSLAWSFGPSINWNFFDAGRVRANIEVQKSIEEQTILRYKKTILTALQDVENALIAYAKEQQRRQALLDAVNTSRKAVDLATQLYTQGLVDFLNVLNAQSTLFRAEDSLAQSNRRLSTDVVALYKALGGGWDHIAK